MPYGALNVLQGYVFLNLGEVVYFFKLPLIPIRYGANAPNTLDAIPIKLS